MYLLCFGAHSTECALLHFVLIQYCSLVNGGAFDGRGCTDGMLCPFKRDKK